MLYIKLGFQNLFPELLNFGSALSAERLFYKLCFLFSWLNGFSPFSYFYFSFNRIATLHAYIGENILIMTSQKLFYFLIALPDPAELAARFLLAQDRCGVVWNES